MPKTISFHNGTAWSRGHNIRDERYTNKQEHIDQKLSNQNVVLRDIPVRQAYKDIFENAVEEYNVHQKRADRRIDDYYNKIKKDKRKHPVYECIVQIGDRSDTGNSAKLEKQALQRFAEEWGKRNPNLRLIGAYIHCDEPDGTVHMHLDYIPVATCTRGMSVQNSLDRALQQQGFHSENIHQTAQIAWQDSEREALCVICRDLDIDIQRNQGISEDRGHLSKREYIKAKEEQQAQINDELKPLKEALDEYRELDVSAKAFVVEKKKVPFAKKVTVSMEDIQRLEEQAKAYRVNQWEIETLRTRKQELAKRETSLDQRTQKLDEQQTQLEKNQQAVKKMYARQRDVNKLLDQAEQQISSLTAENGSLSCAMQRQAQTIQELQAQLDGAYESITSIVKAVGMLKYDKKDGYGVELTDQQGRLIDAIAKYGARWAREDGYPDLAKVMDEKIGISQGIQEDIQELTPKRSRGRNGMSL